MYLLDTTTVSDYLRGDKNVLARLKATSPKLIAISSITKFEIEYGLIKKPSLRKVYTEQIQEIYAQTKDIQFDSEVATMAALIRNELVKAGTPIGVADLFIAAIARHHNLIVVTSNIRHFEKISHLNWEDWKTT
ncbi:MAG: PIN domain-containing protein [Pleurocapsa sp.]